MIRRLKIPLLVLVGLVVVVGGYVTYLYVITGELKSIEPHFDGTCQRVPGAPGPEDITIDPRSSIAYVSSDDRRATIAGRPVPGAIFAYDLAGPRAVLRNLTPDAGPTFHPHGIALLAAPDGRTLLFVVNHPRSSLFGDSAGQGPAHTIEIFERAGAGPLVHKRTIGGDLLVSPNDIAPVGEDRFYVTNDHGFPPGPGRMIEEYARLKRANVLYFDGHSFSEAAGGLRYANGIAVSPDGARVFVSTLTSFRVAIFDRDAATGALRPAGDIEVGTGPDNLEIDAAGDLWIGAHPKLLSFVAHAKDRKKLSPSQVLHVHAKDGKYEVEEVFLSRGDDLSGSSVAAARDGRLLIGSVFDPYFLDCRLR